VERVSWRRRRERRRGEGEAPEHEESHAAREGRAVEQLLQHARHQRRVLLQQLRHDGHQNHLAARLMVIWCAVPLRLSASQDEGGGAVRARERGAGKSGNELSGGAAVVGKLIGYYGPTGASVCVWSMDWV
jgi:hypothetical protein